MKNLIKAMLASMLVTIISFVGCIWLGVFELEKASTAFATITIMAFAISFLSGCLFLVICAIKAFRGEI